jgi:hypothetical protein
MKEKWQSMRKVSSAIKKAGTDAPALKRIQV